MSKKVSNEVMISYGYIMTIKFKMNERLGSYVLTNFFFLICNSDVCGKNKNCLEKEKVAKKTLASLQKEAVRHKNCNLKH